MSTVKTASFIIKFEIEIWDAQLKGRYKSNDKNYNLHKEKILLWAMCILCFYKLWYMKEWFLLML